MITVPLVMAILSSALSTVLGFVIGVVLAVRRDANDERVERPPFSAHRRELHELRDYKYRNMYWELTRDQHFERITELNHDVARLSRQLDVAAAEKANLNMRIAELTSELDGSSNTANSLGEEIKRLTNMVLELNATIRRQLERIDELTRQHKAMELLAHAGDYVAARVVETDRVGWFRAEADIPGEPVIHVRLVDVRGHDALIRHTLAVSDDGEDHPELESDQDASTEQGV